MKHGSRLLFAMLSFALAIIAGSLKAQIDEKKLAAGDETAIRLLASAPLEELYDVLMAALTHQLGPHSKRIENESVAAIRKYPTHAQVLGDKIESLSTDRRSFTQRDNLFLCLSAIGSPQAIEQMGRFLFDERNPKTHLDGDDTIGGANSYLAANALGSVLSDKLDLKRKPGYYTKAELKAWQEWWKSPAAQPFREPPAKAQGTSRVTLPQTVELSQTPFVGTVKPAGFHRYAFILFVIFLSACFLLVRLKKK